MTFTFFDSCFSFSYSFRFAFRMSLARNLRKPTIYSEICPKYPSYVASIIRFRNYGKRNLTGLVVICE